MLLLLYRGSRGPAPVQPVFGWRRAASNIQVSTRPVAALLTRNNVQTVKR